MSRPRRDAALAKTIGDRVRSMRRERGITQEQLAWACEVEKGYLSAIEGGRKMPSLPMLAILAQELAVELVDLVVVDSTAPRSRLLEASRRCRPEQIEAVVTLLRADPPL